MQYSYTIINVRGHLEAYLDGKFICSGDKMNEIKNDLREYENKSKN